MLSVYMGRPGAGKSYSACVMIRDELWRGRNIVTNLPVNEAAFVEDLSRRARDKALERRIAAKRWGGAKRSISWRVRLRRLRKRAPGRWWSRRFEGRFECVSTEFFWVPENWQRAVERWAKSGGSVVVVDEAGSVFDRVGAGLQGAQLAARKAELMKVLREHRHYYSEIVLLCQSHHQLDSAGAGVKSLVEEWVSIVNTRLRLGVNGYVMRADPSHTRIGAKEALWTRPGRYRPEIFALYRSHDLGKRVGVEEDGVERSVAKGSGSWRVWLGASVVLAGAVGLGLLGWWGGGMVGRMAGWIEDEPAAAADVDFPKMNGLAVGIAARERSGVGRKELTGVVGNEVREGGSWRAVGEGCVVTRAGTRIFEVCPTHSSR